MKKPLKVLSATALSGILATSALVPVAAADASVEEVSEFAVQNVIVVLDGKNIEVSYEDFLEYYGFLNAEEKNIDKVVFGTEYMANAEDYLLFYGMADNDEERYEVLKEQDLLLKVETISGTVSFEGIEYDEQPEDRLNETFFYNVA